MEGHGGPWRKYGSDHDFPKMSLHGSPWISMVNVVAEIASV
jgi:hypothetical protein